jgi:hypothetical protein
VDPHWFNADPDPDFLFIADPDLQDPDPTLQNMKFFTFLKFLGSFLLSWDRIHNIVEKCNTGILFKTTLNPDLKSSKASDPDRYKSSRIHGTAFFLHENVKTSVPDPDPNPDPQYPHVFGPHGYGSGLVAAQSQSSPDFDVAFSYDKNC